MPDKREQILEDKYVRTEVVAESGQWVVYVEIGNLEGSVRHRIESYHRKSLAEIAAKWIKRTAEKENIFRFERG